MEMALPRRPQLTLSPVLLTEALALAPPTSFHYLRQSGCIADETANDRSTFHDVLVG